MISKALAQTALMWPPLVRAYAWVHQVAKLLDNPTDLTSEQLQEQLQQILAKMEQHKEAAGE